DVSIFLKPFLSKKGGGSMKKRMLVQLILISMAVIIWIGCSNEQSTTDHQPNSSSGPEVKAPETPEIPKNMEPPKPVTLTFLNGNGLNDQEFELLFVNPVQKKYPHITVVKTSTNNINNLIAAGETPDLISTHNGNFGIYQELD